VGGSDTAWREARAPRQEKGVGASKAGLAERDQARLRVGNPRLDNPP